MRRQSFRARWIFPGDAPPWENATIEIESGRINAIHLRADSQAVDLGNAVLIPGLVNAHTHLEFSDLTAPIEPSRPFTDWIRAIVQSRRERTEPLATVIAQGLAESVRCGVTTLGEIATVDLSADDVQQEPQRLTGSAGADSQAIENPSLALRASEIPVVNGRPRMVVFRELIGLRPDQIEPQLEIAHRHLQNRPQAAAGIVHGLSPHAPYSLHPELFCRLIRLAADQRAPIAVHLAETREEIELLASGSGPLVEMLERFGVWEPDIFASGTRPLDYLRELVKSERALVVHGNYLDDEELKLLADHENLTLIYCPRTHAFFGHTAHPWRKLRAHGGRVALGSDSRGSNPDLSLWNELRCLQERHRDIGVEELLRIGTINGAIALGLDDETGSLTPGKSADFAVVTLAAGESASNLLSGDQRITATMLAGRWNSFGT